MPRLKVKDMPRKQQMAVKATMADGGKGNPNKMKASALKLKKSPSKNKLAKKTMKAAISSGAEATSEKVTLNAFKGLKKKKSPALAKLSASCKAAARRKFKVYPSAYANMWASRTQKAGKC